MINFLQSTEFPSQRVSDTEKEKYEWYSQCCDFIIAQGESFRNTKDIELKYDILQGKLPEESPGAGQAVPAALTRGLFTEGRAVPAPLTRGLFTEGRGLHPEIMSAKR